MRDLAVRKGVHHMVGLQARGAREFNRVRDLVAEGYVGKVLSCTMIITTPAWGTEFTRDWAYMAERSNGNTLMTSPGGHAIDALCYCLGEFKELSSVVANQRQRVKIVETGEMIQMTAPDQVLLSGVLQSGAVASVHLKGGTANGVPVRDPRDRGRPGYRADRPVSGDLHTGLRVHGARCASGQTAGGSLDTGELSLGSNRGTGGACLSHWG